MVCLIQFGSANSCHPAIDNISTCLPSSALPFHYFYIPPSLSILSKLSYFASVPTDSTTFARASKLVLIVHYDTSAMKRFLTSVSLQHEPKASDVITLVKKTFFRMSIVRNFISQGVKMRISAREACVKPHLRTLSDIKVF